MTTITADAAQFTASVEDFPMPSAGYTRAKRMLDIVLALAGIVILAPFFAAVALAILFDSGRPVLFRQMRVGHHGRMFVIVKFRSMRRDADEATHRRFVQALFAGGEAPSVFKVANDDRITHLGRLLRRTSVDELPQLWNVLRGEMSLVGPRPDVPYSVDGYASWMRQRLAATPGITGLWQIRGRSELSLEQMFRLDLEYVAHRSFWFDLAILVRTIPAVLARKGAA